MLTGGPFLLVPRDRGPAAAAAGAARPGRRRCRDRRRRLHRPLDGVLPEARRPLAAHLRAGAGGLRLGRFRAQRRLGLRRRRRLRRSALAGCDRRCGRRDRPRQRGRGRGVRLPQGRRAARRHGGRPAAAAPQPPGLAGAGAARRADPRRRRARRRVRARLRPRPAGGAGARAWPTSSSGSGVGVYEATRVESIAPGVARTAHGDVRASWVVRATEGYTPHLGGAPPRALIPLRSTMIVTEPLPDDVWEQIGWQGAELRPRRGALVRLHPADRRRAHRDRGRGRPYYFRSGYDRYGEVENSALDRLDHRLHELWPATREVADRARLVGRVRGAARLEADGRGRPRHRPRVGGRLRGRGRLRGEPVGPDAGRPGARRADRPGLAAVREPRRSRATGSRSRCGTSARNLVYTLFRAADRDERRTGEPVDRSAILQPGSPAGAIARPQASEGVGGER